MARYKTFDATGVAPGGRLYAGDLNAIQDMKADLSNFAQTIQLANLQVGEAGLQLLFYGSGEARLTGKLRTDGYIRPAGGLWNIELTTAERDALVYAPQGLQIYNTTTDRPEYNRGTDAVRDWQPFREPSAAPDYTLAQWPPANPVQGQRAALADTHNGRKFRWVFEYRPDLDAGQPWNALDDNPYVRAGNQTLSVFGNVAGVWAYSGQLWTLPIAGDWLYSITGGGETGAPANGGNAYAGITNANGTPPAGQGLQVIGGLGGPGIIYSFTGNHDGHAWDNRPVNDPVYLAIANDHGNTQTGRNYGFVVHLKPRRI